MPCYFNSLMSTIFLLLPVTSPRMCRLVFFFLLPQSSVDQFLVTSSLFYRLVSYSSSSLLCRPASCYVLSSTDQLPVTSPVLCRHVSCYLLSLLSTSLLFFLSVASTSLLLRPLFYRPPSCYFHSLVSTCLLLPPLSRID